MGGNFNCDSNRLTSLEGAPRYIDGNFNCSNNWMTLTSLEGLGDGLENVGGEIDGIEKLDILSYRRQYVINSIINS